MLIKFECTMKMGKKIESWSGMITKLTKFGSHYELKIESRSGFIVVIGKTNYGNFACIPDYDVGCHLSTLNDLFWNSERLSAIMNKVDAITVANALQAIAEHIDLN
ncbi:hypothetical protein K9O30_23005 [Clostridium bowmanii]|uniref:DUF6618 family protein n=1 Tax=Clostridium bowmanii TaxID=132925 RepID=UPI001C0CA108|nr:DUF6618 family protein [Clostridium bowmanii]MBU3192290.1 hypothetical protein [Clostridium bowmanii]MCA1076519.1 hypothetical protein [Clostridium bowmanii]